MKSRIILSLVFSLLLAGSLFAANNIFTGAVDNLWSNPNNWSEGRVPDASNTARIQNGVFCVVDYAAPPIDHINIRTGGNVLQLVDGAHLVSNDWAVISLNGGTPENRDVMEILGGVFDCHSHFRVADDGAALLVIDYDGVFNLHDVEFRVGHDTGGDGIVELRGGSLNLLDGVNALPLVFRNGTNSKAHIDFSGGVMKQAYSDVRLAYVNDHVADGTITAYNGVGTIITETTEDGILVVKGLHPLSPAPEDGGSVMPGNITLNWILPDPCTPGEAVAVDVYFTDDLQSLEQFIDPAAIRVVNNQAVNSIVVQAQPKTRYYWAVDSYVGSAADPVFGPIFSFVADNIPPRVNTSADVVTWLQDGSSTGNLDGTVTDNDAYTVQWTVVSEPDDPNNPDALIADLSAEDTTITLSAVGEYVLQLEATENTPARMRSRSMYMPTVVRQLRQCRVMNLSSEISTGTAASMKPTWPCWRKTG